MPQVDPDSPVRRRPGRPRSPEADRAILDATLELLLSEGLRGLSIETVARRAGVGKNTIYRRHPTKPALVAAAVRSLYAPEPDPPSTGTLRGDIGAIHTSAAERDSRLRLILRLMVDSFEDQELAAIVHQVLIAPVRAHAHIALRRAKERDEVLQEVDEEQFADLLYGPMTYRAMLGGGELSDPAEYLQRTVDALTPWLTGKAPV